MNFFNRYKKYFLAAGFLVTTFIIGYFLYALFFKPSLSPKITTPPAGGEEDGPGGFPQAKTGDGQIIDEKEKTGLPPDKTGAQEQGASEIARGGKTITTKLNNTPTLGATISANGRDMQYYDKKDGIFYRIDKDGETTPLSQQIFHNVQDITWANSKNKAILEYPDGSNIIYDFNSEKQTTLPAHWKNFGFSPDSNRIVMKSMGLDPDNRWLAVTESDGSKVRPIEPLGTKDATVFPTWPNNNQIIAMFTEGRDFDRQEVYFVGLNNENFKSMIVNGRGFEYLWTPSGDKLLYSVYSSKTDLKPSLWLVNAQGEAIGSGRSNLNIETWAHKCTYSGADDLYCAVPDSLEEGAGLFPSLAADANDNLYKINTDTGLKELIAVPDGSYSMKNLQISDNGFYLFFTDVNTERLYKIKLK